MKHASGFLAIVNDANKTTTITTREAANVFLKKKVQWGDGTKILAVVLSDTSPVSQAFDKQILNKSIAALHAYWQQEIFSGRNVPPVEKATDDEVVAFVQKNPGAIGYIAGNAAHPGVHVVSVTE